LKKLGTKKLEDEKTGAKKLETDRTFTNLHSLEKPGNVPSVWGKVGLHPDDSGIDELAAAEIPRKVRRVVATHWHFSLKTFSRLTARTSQGTLLGQRT
jgi:hypothetical protein